MLEFWEEVSDVSEGYSNELGDWTKDFFSFWERKLIVPSFLGYLKKLQ
jgi:hypothetical protein